MIRKDVKKYKSGVKTHVRVVEGYRDDDGKIKQRTIKSFGFLEDQTDQEKFMQMVKDFDDNFLLSKKAKKDSFLRPFNENNYNKPINYGYKFIESIYNCLELDKYFSKKYSKAKYDLNDIFKFLVIQRILNPDSKRATFQTKDSLYLINNDFELEDIYRSLDKINDYKIEIQKHLNDKVKAIIGRNSEYAYYDVTNYYCEIDFPDEDGLRKRGVSKEHRVDPIVQMGLFIDNNSLPISMSLFKGNTADTKTLQPIMIEIKKNYNLNRLVVVADKGLNSSSNINYIINNGDGYVVSQILRGKKGKKYQDKLLDDSLFTYNSDRTFKYYEYIEDYEIINLNNEKETKKRKVLIYWKYDDAILEAKKREDKLGRALKSLGNNAYSIKHTYEEYIKEVHSVEKTGEVANKVTRELDEDKVSSDALYDGYFCIITSEIEYDYKKILEVYGSLWKIEESFRITKSELDARPIYMSTEEHINAHFMICFVALLIVRMLQYKLNFKMSVERIVRALNTSNCLVEENNTIHVLQNQMTIGYDDTGKEINETLEDYIKIIQAYNIDIPFERYKEGRFKKYLNAIKY